MGFKNGKIIRREGFDPLELNSGNVQAIFNRCCKKNEDGSNNWIEEALKVNKPFIFYLLGQLALIHNGVTKHELDTTFVKRYDGHIWTDTPNLVIDLLNMGGQSNSCSFYKEDGKQFVELKKGIKATLSPQDPDFTVWYEQNGKEYEAEHALAVGEKAYNDGDYSKARASFKEAQEKGNPDAKYALNRLQRLEEDIEAAKQGDAEAQYRLATFYGMPDKLEWLEKAAAQGNKAAVITKKLFQNGNLTSDEIAYLRENYVNLSSSVRNAYDNYMVRKINSL